MKQCRHSAWLGLRSQGSETQLLVSSRLENLTKLIPDPHSRHPSLLVLIGNTGKSVALRELFGARRDRQGGLRRGTGEIHLHFDPSAIFFGRPLFIAEGDICNSPAGKIVNERCHDVVTRTVQRPRRWSKLEQISNGLYAQLLYPFADVFCFFSDDIGGFRQVARCLAEWLEQGCVSRIHPRVVIVTEKVPVGSTSEKEARKAFLWMLEEETARDPLQQMTSIDVIALFPSGSVSVDARLRPLKELLLKRSDQVRQIRAESRYLFSTAHLAAFLDSACEHFTAACRDPFDFVSASRAHNPVAPDLDEHFSNFIRQIKTAQDLAAFAAPVLGSSLLLDNYPPGTHCTSTTTSYHLESESYII